MLIDVHDHGIASPDEKNKVACNYCGKEYFCKKYKQADLEQIEEYVSKVKDSWAVTGCSIVIDEWEDDKRRHLINFLAESPEGTIYIGSFDISSHVSCLGILQKLLEFVIDNVGLKNVVQIIVADTVSWMLPATRQIVFKHKNVCWSLGASHYIGLMLYNIGLMEPYREILNKAKTLTEFVHGHTDVLKMFRSNNLKNMFASSEWTDSDWASTTQGKWVDDLLRDITFWEKNPYTIGSYFTTCRHVQDLISQQLQKYEQGEGSFKDGSTLQGLQDASPTEWWSRYGAQCPELQKHAIRILSQTCEVTKYKIEGIERLICEYGRG
ncbi:hypothetical protein Q3G72_012640 [Acer saccharum]|nr:hypothetical protein Q3G72_012640 [Acer saccharum]